MLQSVITRKVLVLNADYRAFSVCSVYKAFVLVYMDKADIVNRTKDLLLRTIDKAYEVPTVIKLRNYVNIPYRNVMLSRQNVFKRDKCKCVYCSSTKDLTIDHVIPKSRGGKTQWDNLVTACKRCNSKKGDMLLEEIDDMELPYKPFRPSFVMFLRDFSNSGDDSWIEYLQS